MKALRLSLIAAVAWAAGCSDGSDAPGDGETSTTGEASASDAGGSQASNCVAGERGCTCQAKKTCDEGLTCISSVCVERPASECGDGVLDPGEDCDQGDFNSDDAACKSDCTLQVCGDGAVGPGEECDDGNKADDDNCSSVCTRPVCGNGVVEGAEACDDNNDLDTDDCPRTCLPAKCGDGFVHEGEEACDDNNLEDGDGCSSQCEREPQCGDGAALPGEYCFHAAVPILTGQQPVAFGVEDLNGDGKLDVGIINGDDATITVALGDGDGGFAAAPGIPTGAAAPSDGAFGDFDADGLGDVATIHPATSELFIHYGTGVPTVPDALDSPLRFDNGWVNPTTITAAEVDSRRVATRTKPELLIGEEGGVGLVVVLDAANRGTPTFSRVSLSAGVWSATGADLTGDNLPTVVAVVPSGAIHTIEFLVSTRTLGAVSTAIPSGVAQPSSVVAGALDGDMFDDLILPNWDRASCDYRANAEACAGEEFGLALGDGAGSIDTPTTLTGGKAPVAAAIGDIDGDGAADLAVAHRFDDTVVIWAGDGTGGFTEAATLAVFGHEPIAVAIRDVTGDGAPELLTLERYTNTVSVFGANR